MVSIILYRITYLLKPHTSLYFSAADASVDTDTSSVSTHDDSSSTSSVCSEIDKILETARQLSISNPTKGVVKTRPFNKSPSHITAKTDHLSTRTTMKASLKQTERVYKPLITSKTGKQSLKTGLTSKQATPPNLVTPVVTIKSLSSTSANDDNTGVHLLIENT